MKLEIIEGQMFLIVSEATGVFRANGRDEFWMKEYVIFQIDLLTLSLLLHCLFYICSRMAFLKFK